MVDMSEREKLEANYRVLVDRVSDKALELGEAEVAHADTVGDLVNGAGKRADVLAKRAALAVEADALRAELKELQRRRDVADLARFEYELAEAERELVEAAAKSTAARKAMDSAMETRGHTYQPGHGAETPESARHLAALEAKVVYARTESGIAGRDAEVARKRRDDARLGLEEARTRLGVAESRAG